MKYLLLAFALLLLLVACTSPAPPAATSPSTPIIKPIRVLITGGGDSHDFARWYGITDSATLKEIPNLAVTYTENVDTIAPLLADIDVLCIANNKPFNQAATRAAIMDFANRGKGIVLLHAGMWYSWTNWPDFNRLLVGGGSRAHDSIRQFQVTVTDPAHPVMQGIPATFTVTDELYNQQSDPAGTPIHPLATAFSTLQNKAFPSIFLVEHPHARIVGIALGHDGRTHELPTYQQLLKNAVTWAAGPRN